MAPLPSLSIREVAERSGCPASALRYYEDAGLIAALPRLETAARCYDPRVLDTLSVITALRGVGFGIREIRALLDIRQPGDPAPLRLKKAEQALDRLTEVLAERRRTLEEAEKLLRRWEAEVAEAQQS
ncbi:MerR family transcriptional regulator [Deinococcus radiodurans R1 = ATCC 13939 = DSM 20539]|uniref:Transcriptional regulator, MerR family n=1 Tax=Deinococcus radiodurans (strain ATCC 13939 / DSM 20539 / JCM 16871 / CCUG 27074 / LMG 4051 / NBRC 15346 / NCIMB 9279 / VKM B-1422 / R1) TaxID=243230 RepID=Q9RRH2_DEIRA|nr:transcriptional regulator, MerR family [Deinococcus radiodurans R1 = ATCC 13939 = DSM 20539]QEM71882.1 MerR family transcriptional regulator [Deinococcus radiodurans]UDL01524.1 MerR family transcriptional regulator [Deinococcus radiodurans R1 = ATCC 13939 = DSM 20539]UID71475.1 transcriptional regulator, MerR family [Deinococcus radiodurans R1 = ATCC 13939 = DSM 20539]HCE64138.1 MerR family DNA-binding transcriptional regulator [Deinococcus radiodurans]